MRFIKVAFIIAVLLVVIIGGLILKTFRDAGEFKKIKPHFSGQWEAITGVLSSEDITIHPQTGRAFISSDDRRSLFRGEKGRPGAIYVFDLISKKPQLINLTTDFSFEFHPHGIGLFIDQSGGFSLFVVNHRQNGHFVEIFDYKKKRLVHRESIAGELMHSPNDVIPVGPRSFYVTNDHGNASGFGRTLEEYLQLARSYVLYYNGKDFHTVAKGLAYANGINMSHDGKTIYVAETIGGGIRVYDRDTTTGALQFRHFIEAGTGVDNIEVDETGNLWIGAHPKLLTFVKYSKDPKEWSPSQVLKITVKEHGHYRVDEIYLNKGDDISGSSVAAVFKNRMLIGSVFDERFLLCNLNKKDH